MPTRTTKTIPWCESMLYELRWDKILPGSYRCSLHKHDGECLRPSKLSMRNRVWTPDTSKVISGWGVVVSEAIFNESLSIWSSIFIGPRPELKKERKSARDELKALKEAGASEEILLIFLRSKINA